MGPGNTYCDNNFNFFIVKLYTLFQFFGSGFRGHSGSGLKKRSKRLNKQHNLLFRSVSDPIPDGSVFFRRSGSGFISPDPDPSICKNLCDLNEGFDKVLDRGLEPACFWAAPAPGIFYPELAPALAPGKREHSFGTSTCRSYFMFTLEKTPNDVKLHEIYLNY